MPPQAAAFAKCSPPLLKTYPHEWVRMAAAARPSVLDWDSRDGSRFSHLDHPFKVLYLADNEETAFWEVFGEKIEDMPSDNRALSVKADLDSREWVDFTIDPALRLIDVTDEATLHALRSNASTWLAPYKYCQAWARAIMDHPQKIDGFVYQACRRGATARCLALFSRPEETTMGSFVRGARRTPSQKLSDDPVVDRILVQNEIDRR